MLNKLLKNKHIQALFDQGFASGVAFLSFLVLVRSFGTEDFGTWVMYTTFVNFLEMIKTGFLSASLIKFSSGQSKEVKNRLIGTSFVLNLLITLGFTLVVVLMYYLVPLFSDNDNSSFYLVLFYPLFSLLSIPYNYFQWSRQVDLDFASIVKLRAVNVTMFLLVTLAVYFFNKTLLDLVLMQLLVFGLTSLISIFMGGTGIKFLSECNRDDAKLLTDFGKYNTLVFLGSNVLKSADVFLIGSFMGNTSVAIYSIALRFVELIELPIKGVGSVLMPKLSLHHNRGDMKMFGEALNKYLGLAVVVYVPFILGLFIISSPLIMLVGGEQYLDSVFIFRLFLIYGLFTPFDRLTGVGLNALNMPRQNFIKVTVMALFNIIGDLLVIHFFESFNLVAVVTIFNALIGICIGVYFLRKMVEFSAKGVYDLLKSQVSQMLN